MRVLLIALLATFLAGTGAYAQKVSVEVDPAARFPNYHTFAISHKQFTSTDPKLSPDLIKKRIEAAIQCDLTARGLAMVAGPGPADLIVVYTFRAQGMVRTTTTHYSGSGTNVYREPFSEVALVVDLRDAAAHSVVWHAVATVDKINTEKVEGKIDDMIGKALKKYPVNSKSVAGSTPSPTAAPVRTEAMNTNADGKGASSISEGPPSTQRRKEDEAKAADSSSLNPAAAPEDDVRKMNAYRQAAEAGDKRAMDKLGVMYEHGRGGLPQDGAQAMNWYRKAAEAGDGPGMVNLGRMYLNGQGGLAKDDAQAVNWFRKAAEAGDARGMANLGGMYANGRGGLPKDDVEALSWFRKAAEAGDAHGMTDVAIGYLNGRGGLTKDDAQALSWFRKAAEAGDAHGMAALGVMYQNGRADCRRTMLKR